MLIYSLTLKGKYLVLDMISLCHIWNVILMKKTEILSTAELRLFHFQSEMKMQCIYFAGTLITLNWSLWLIDNDFSPKKI